MEDLCSDKVNNDQVLEKQRLIELSNKRTRNWKDTIENKKIMKDVGRFEKFEREEKNRREIDRQEKEYQQKVREGQIEKSNRMIFEQTDKVKKLKGAMMLADAL